jgi:V/A-type H+/Na+-transporting ATPase subunit B
VAGFRDFLLRFRRVGSPGRAAPGGVPADRAAELAAELAPPLSLLEEVEAEARRIREEAARVAADRRRDAERQADTIVGRARARADEVRAQAAARVRRAYPGYLYSDLASLYERCGRIRGRSGSVTVLPVLTMPAGDITHPVPDLTGYITEGQIVLSRQPHALGVYPPVDALSSLSRLMRKGAGPGRTRPDHLDVAAQTLAALSRARQVRELSDLVGQEALSPTDRRYLDFDEAFSHRFMDQRRDETRPLDRTLDAAWQVLLTLPRSELALLPTALLDAHGGRDEPPDGEREGAGE